MHDDVAFVVSGFRDQLETYGMKAIESNQYKQRKNLKGHFGKMYAPLDTLTVATFNEFKRQCMCACVCVCVCVCDARVQIRSVMVWCSG